MSKFELVELEQGTPEWHALRKNSIGASDIPVIMGLSPWQTPYELWARKLGLMEQIKTLPHMTRGLEIEDEVRNWVSELLEISYTPIVARSIEFPWAIASLDGWNEKEGVLEIKCPNAEDHQKAIANQVPEKYRDQIQWQLFITGASKALYVSYPGKVNTYVMVEADKKRQKKLLKAAEIFHKKILNQEAPALTDKDICERTDEEWIRTARDYKEAYARLKFAELEVDSLKQALIELLDGAKNEGGGVRVSVVKRKGSVDYKAVPELIGVDLEPYRKEETTSHLVKCLD